MSASKSVISFNNVSKEFIDGKDRLLVLNEINFNLNPGEQVAIVGKSGSGKSTLLQLMSGLDSPTVGSVSLMGTDYQKMNERQLDLARNKTLGFVYQFHHLLPEFTALENIMMPLLVKGETTKVAEQIAVEMLNKIGLADRQEHPPSKLSGGEKQRVAIARAIICNPECVFADEPTGNLDPETGKVVIELIRTVNKVTAIVIVTHDIALAQQFDKIYKIENGRLSLSE
ncbi:MAG: ABC transporter ATP-binding protein [Francisellaceae bacterium]|jgi:lipoprotein-releasing system ATP-binding protein|nr:ABC transporter ATP-binding protein [Francisellaceae bacterium]MBT6206473.1 ABC transporter ATP-binding protein [Francisellaceae bacterium]MBT6538925.1 ABC transporter ATP-binding protein [Francisellaceae bacterium]